MGKLSGLSFNPGRTLWLGPPCLISRALLVMFLISDLRTAEPSMWVCFQAACSTHEGTSQSLLVLRGSPKRKDPEKQPDRHV